MRDDKGLDDPEYAAFAWARFRRILWWMAGASLIAVALAELWLWWTMEKLDWFTAIATAIGFFVTIMLTAALMGLIFLSSGSGHDEQVIDPLKDEIDLD
jgi:hypothetical protein